MANDTQKNDTQKNKWEHFPHGADIGVRGIAPTIEKAFAMAAKALMAVVADPEKVDAKNKISIHCEESDPELLFLDWMNALIYEMDTRLMLFSDFEVLINNGKLTAEVSGETIDSKKHELAVEIKGATMTELKVFKSGDFWTAQCVVDV